MEAKGLTLSQVEKLLPLADQLNLLPLAAANKETILSLAPLLIEPAPALLPIIVGLLSNPAVLTLPGALLGGLGVYEVVEGNTVGGILALVPALPLLAIGSLLGSKVSVPTVSSSAPMTVGQATPSKSFAASAPKVSSRAQGGAMNGKRRTIRL